MCNPVSLKKETRRNKIPHIYQLSQNLCAQPNLVQCVLQHVNFIRLGLQSKKKRVLGCSPFFLEKNKM